MADFKPANIEGSPYNLKIAAVIEGEVPATGWRYDAQLTESDICHIFGTDEQGMSEMLSDIGRSLMPASSISDHLVFYPKTNLNEELDPENPPKNWCISFDVINQSQIDSGGGTLYLDLTDNLGLTWEHYINIHEGYTITSDTWRTYIFAILVIDSEHERKGLIFCSPYIARPNTGSIYGLSGSIALNLTYFENEGNFTYSINNIDEDFGPGSEPDGYGQNTKPAFDHTSDTITIPDPPSVSTSSVGFMHVYKVASGALSTLGQYLFPSAQNITDIESALRALAGIFAYRDSVQYIVDLHAIPVSPTTGGNEYIKIGSLETDISQPIVPSDYVDFDCGSISIPEQYTNFVDYIGTRCKLFLPFVGFVEIAPEYWNGGTISVKYRFNVIDGSFMAYVRATSSKSNLTDSLIGQYGGSACLHLPVIANSYGALASGLVGGSMQIAAGAATGNVGGAVAGALTAGNFQGNMSQSNNYNASTSFLGGRRPYLLIEREVPCFSTNYPHDKGLPLNVAVSLAQLRGFTIIDDIDLSGITGATDNELDELRNLLKEGVYF